MASTRLNVLVYSGPGSTIESVRHCLYSLRRLLSPNYAVYSVTGETILKEPWAASCALLVVPGGADLPYCRTLDGEGNRRIRQYVHSGGAYIGFCAGGYYASSRCEFEVGNEKMEVVGDRELGFYPDICRGPAFPGFQYQSESGTRATELRIERGSFPSSGGILPQVFRAYVNGGSVFVNASKHKDRGVEVLASYTEQLNVDSGEGTAAVVFCKVGEGCALLTGPHPEFATVNLSKTARDMSSAVVGALAEDDKQRSDFLKACLLKIGLRVNQDEHALPSLSTIHFSSSEEGGVAKVLSALQEIVTPQDGRDIIKSQHDTFDISKHSSTWSMSNLIQTVTGTTTEGEADDTADKIIDYDQIVKRIVTHEQEPPSAKETPYFNHGAYFANLQAYQNSTRFSRYHEAQIGNYLMYGEVVTSTSTLLEKNPSLTSFLPTGTTFTATTQLSGRGRGSNVWISPAGSLMFSFVLRHRLVLNATAPVVFIQYLAALAVAEGVQTYDQQQEGGSSRRSRYKDVPVKLKWPNDIYALDPGKKNADPEDRNAYVKVGGILVNSSYSGGDYTLIVGIGLNVSNAAPTTSLNAMLDAFNASVGKTQQQSLPPFTPEKLLARILTSFTSLYATFCRSGFGGELEQLYYKHWLHSEQMVTLETEGGARARVRGITSDWGLLKAEEVVGEGERGTGRMFALQTDSNSFDFFRGLIKRKI